MGHNILADGTAYAVKSGSTMAGGTVYAVKKGVTLVEGTVREIGFPYPITVVITGESKLLQMGTRIEIDGVVYGEAGTWVFDTIGSMTVENLGLVGARVYLNGEQTDNPYTFVPDCELVTIAVKSGTPSHSVEITTA